MRTDAEQQRIDEGKRKLREFLRGPGGAKALAFLRSFTVEAVQGPDASEAKLRHHNGMCALVKQLESLADEKDPKDE